jgi:hypothetical protein
MQRSSAFLSSLLALSVAAHASAESPTNVDPEQERYDRERFAQYARNRFTFGFAANRSHISSDQLDETLWTGRLEGGLLLPLTDGAGPLWTFNFGIGGGKLEDGVLFTMPLSFAYGYRTPFAIAYAGGTFGVGGAFGDGAGELGPLFGVLARLGIGGDRVQLLAEARWELVPLRAGQSFSVWGFGPVVVFVP